MLGVPLLREGSPIGVIVLMRTAVRPFTDKQIELVTTFADQAVIAIENVRLFDEVQARTRELSESLQQQTATAECSRSSAARPFDLQPVFETVAESATRLCEADKAFIFRFDGELLQLAVAVQRLPRAYGVRGAQSDPARTAQLDRPAPRSNAEPSTSPSAGQIRNMPTAALDVRPAADLARRADPQRRSRCSASS